MAKKALVTGITGQDGAYLAEYLLSQGYVVHGLRRWASNENTQRLVNLDFSDYISNGRFHLHYGDLTDSAGVINVVQNVQPDEIYNLAAMSHVHVSFEQPEYTTNVDALGTVRLLEAIRILGLQNTTRFYQASTSELFGNTPAPQNEQTPFRPCSPYATAKLYSYWITRNYREAYDLFACNGILFNHESPLRGEDFVTRKITRAVARIALGRQKTLTLGNLNATRDWGHAKDYVRAMHMMVQHDAPDDFVIATGQANTVREFAKLAFAGIGIDLSFEGEGVNEKAFIGAIDDRKYELITKHANEHLRTGDVVIEVSEEFFRPTDVDQLIGNPSKAKDVLGWEAECTLECLAKEMVTADLVLEKQAC